MFKVKNKKTGEIVQILNAYCDEYGKTWFLLWIKDKWCWRAADNYIPPNYSPKYKWIIAGSRNFQNYPKMCEELDKIRDSIGEIVCGEALGADTLGRTYAYDNAIPIKSFPADWSLGKAAGFIRNKQMAEYADKAIVFWDGESVGTQDMITKMKNYNKECIVIKYNKYKKEG